MAKESPNIHCEKCGCALFQIKQEATQVFLDDVYFQSTTVCFVLCSECDKVVGVFSKEEA